MIVPKNKKESTGLNGFIYFFDWCFTQYSRVFHLYDNKQHDCKETRQYLEETHNHAQVAVTFLHARPQNKPAWAGIEPIATTLVRGTFRLTKCANQMSQGDLLY